MWDEDEGFEEVAVPTARLHPALVVSSVFTLAGNIARSVAEFADTQAMLLAAHFNHTREQLAMQNEAIREIEALTTQGD